MHNEQKVTDSIWWIGGNDFITPRFENAVPLRKGISYNSYVINDDKTALIDAADSSIRDLFMDNLKHVLQGKKLDYVVVNHMEPDHSGSLMAVLEAYPEAKLAASPAAIKLFEQFFRRPMPERYIRTDEKTEISLGTHTLRFLNAPMVHWPEVTFTYEATEKVLFSADAFGTFGAIHGSIFASDTNYEEEYLSENRRYYANIIGKYGMQTMNAIKKAERLDTDILCSLHGPVFRGKEEILRIMNYVRKWASWEAEYQSVTIFFASAHGNTALAAQRLAALLGEKGIRHMKLVDLCGTHVSDAWAEVFRRSHMVLAAPTLNMGLHPKMRYFLDTCTDMGIQNRTVALLGNSSWAPRVAEKIMSDIVRGWKQCRLLEKYAHVNSAAGEEEEEALRTLADAIASDVLA